MRVAAIALLLLAPSVALAAPTGDEWLLLTGSGAVAIDVEYGDGLASTKVGFAQLEGASGGPTRRFVADATCTEWRGTFTQLLVRARPRDSAIAAHLTLTGHVAAPGGPATVVRDAPGFDADLLGGPGAFRGSLVVCDSPTGAGRATLVAEVDDLALGAPRPAVARISGEAPPGAPDRFAEVARLPAPAATSHDHSLRDAILAHYALVGARPTPQGIRELDAALVEVPPEVAAPVARILGAMNAAARVRAASFADVSVDDARRARAASLAGEADAATLDVLSRLDPVAMASASGDLLRAIEEARAQLRLAVAKGASASFVDPLGSVEIAGVRDDAHVANRTLLVDLGGNDVWSNNAGAAMPDLVIESFPGCITTLGPDCTPLAADRHDGSVESVLGRPCSVEVAGALFRAARYVDATDAELGEQVDEGPSDASLRAHAISALDHARATGRAADPDARCAPQGAEDVEPWAQDFLTKGILTDGDEHGVAVALDLGGDDRYAPDLVFNDINDGDNLAGCDTRPLGEAGRTWARNVTAGSAFAGIGILWDDAGADAYGGRSITQGTAHVGAVGVLVDRGAGPDRYSAVRFAQGTGLFGAVGALLDDGGDDTYALENDAPFFNEFEAFVGCDVSTRDGQGRANFDAVGALVDEAGDDVYFVQDHEGDVPGASRDDPLTTQGSTGARLNVGPSAVADLAALGRGVLWDRAGSDSYTRAGRFDGAVDADGTFVDEA